MNRHIYRRPCGRRSRAWQIFRAGCRRDRELAFDGAEDLTPSDFYKEADAISARDGARFVVTTVRPFVR